MLKLSIVLLILTGCSVESDEACITISETDICYEDESYILESVLDEFNIYRSSEEVSNKYVSNFVLKEVGETFYFVVQDIKYDYLVINDNTRILLEDLDIKHLRTLEHLDLGITRRFNCDLLNTSISCYKGKMEVDSWNEFKLYRNIEPHPSVMAQFQIGSEETYIVTVDNWYNDNFVITLNDVKISFKDLYNNYGTDVFEKFDIFIIYVSIE